MRPPLGGLRGRPPPGTAVSAWVVDMLDFRDGRIVGNWVGSDWLGLLVHLGFVPDPWRPDHRLWSRQRHDHTPRSEPSSSNSRSTSTSGSPLSRQRRESTPEPAGPVSIRCQLRSTRRRGWQEDAAGMIDGNSCGTMGSSKSNWTRAWAGGSRHASLAGSRCYSRRTEELVAALARSAREADQTPSGFAT